MQGNDTRIQSPELAHYVGYAEYPHMEMAATALRVGLKDDYRSHLANAEATGIEAGQDYLNRVTKDLANYALVSEMLPEGYELPETEVQPKHEKYPGVRVTKDQIAAYAEEFNLGGGNRKENKRGHMVNPNANKASRLWASLMLLSYDLQVKYKAIETFPEYDSGPSGRVTPLVELEMDVKHQDGISGSRIDDLPSVSMDTLVNLIDEFDRIKERYPSKPTGRILGTNFGDSKLDFLRNFVEYKKAQLAEESSE